ncbi:MAG: hypothetical protein NDF54_05555, partial [archaeon GB-1867-035]|nr:hypothetical protein [Candidatus Culexmicrobium profundum]
HILKSLEGETVCINIHGPEKPPTPGKIKPENMEAIRKAFKPIRKTRARIKDKGSRHIFRKSNTSKSRAIRSKL